MIASRVTSDNHQCLCLVHFVRGTQREQREVSVIYLDHQASTPTHPQVVAAMQPYYTEHYANPHAADHAAGWTAADAIEASRNNVAHAVDADAEDRKSTRLNSSH